MENKNDKYQAALEKCEQLIINTRKHLEYNKKMLRCYERKKRRITKLMEDQKYVRLRATMSEQGVDAEELYKALKSGKLNGFKRPEKEDSVEKAVTDNKENNENTEEEDYGNSKHFEDSGSTG